ncbi:MAG: ChaN family lipoprotein [Elusimicrobia bacterium]|nr:ChaN family lipoprotein [Elusimicrobiota bacterium]
MRLQAALAGLAVAAFAAGAARAQEEGFSDFTLDPARLPAYVKSHARPFEWSEVFRGPERVIYLGDSHDVAACSVELADRLGLAKAAGITHLAVEGLTDDTQDLLDRFRRDGSRAEEVKSAYADGIEAGFHPEAHFSVLEAARVQGLALLAVELPDAELETAALRCYREAGLPPSLLGPDARDLTLDELERLDAVAAKLCRLKDGRCHGRDCRMAANIASLLGRDPGARVLVWTGTRHAYHEHQPRHLQRQFGIASRSYAFWTKGLASAFDVMGEALRAQGKGDEATAIAMPKELGGYDALLWVPRAAKESLGEAGAPAKAPLPAR